MIYTVQAKVMQRYYSMAVLLLDDLCATEAFKFEVKYVVTANVSGGVRVKHCASEEHALLVYEDMLDITQYPGVCSRQQFIDSVFNLN